MRRARKSALNPRRSWRWWVEGGRVDDAGWPCPRTRLVIGSAAGDGPPRGEFPDGYRTCPGARAGPGSPSELTTLICCTLGQEGSTPPTFRRHYGPTRVPASGPVQGRERPPIIGLECFRGYPALDRGLSARCPVRASVLRRSPRSYLLAAFPALHQVSHDPATQTPGWILRSAVRRGSGRFKVLIRRHAVLWATPLLGGAGVRGSGTTSSRWNSFLPPSR